MKVTVRGAALNQVYADAKVVVGDSLCMGFDYPYYWSDRVYETLGRGGFLVHPFIKGMDAHFTGGVDLSWYDFNDFDMLKDRIDFYLRNDSLRERVQQHGHLRVKNYHTYRHRWQAILETLELA